MGGDSRKAVRPSPRGARNRRRSRSPQEPAAPKPTETLAQYAWRVRREVLETQQTQPIVVREFILLTRAHAYHKLTVAEAAAKLDVSRRSLYRLVIRVTGISPGILIDLARVEIVAREISESYRSLGEIARSYGYHSLSDLNKAFVRFAQVRPSLHRLSDRSSRRSAKTANWHEPPLPTRPKAGSIGTNRFCSHYHIGRSP